ncbi:ribonuclease H, partial [Trifolium medium]|nr:ribonuclease H [Trifolium medium]
FHRHRYSCRGSAQKVIKEKSRVFFSNDVDWHEKIGLSNLLGIEVTDDLGQISWGTYGLDASLSVIEAELWGFIMGNVHQIHQNERSVDWIHVVSFEKQTKFQVGPLCLFCTSSGQKVSKEKSRVFFSNNVGWHKKIELSNLLGIQVTDDLGQYLGVPILHKKVTKDTYQFIPDGLVVELGNNAACGGILRDSKGCFIFVFAARMHQLSVIEAEVWGIYYGLKLA